MPTKRELLGADGPPNSLQWSEVRWDRIAAFFGGVGCYILYFSIDLFRYLPEWIAISLAAIPPGLVFHGVTTQPWQTTVKLFVGVGLGIGFPTLLDSAGIHFLP